MSMNDTMLSFARYAILNRAEADGYQPGEYDPMPDDEGYVISLLNALHQWTLAHGRDWTNELTRAQQLFEEDLEEFRTTASPSSFPA